MKFKWKLYSVVPRSVFDYRECCGLIRIPNNNFNENNAISTCNLFAQGCGWIFRHPRLNKRIACYNNRKEISTMTKKINAPNKIWHNRVSLLGRAKAPPSRPKTEHAVTLHPIDQNRGTATECIFTSVCESTRTKGTHTGTPRTYKHPTLRNFSHSIWQRLISEIAPWALQVSRKPNETV